MSNNEFGYVLIERAEDQYIIGARRYTAKSYELPIQNELLSDEERLKKDNANTLRSLKRAIRTFRGYAIANPMKYWVTISFSEEDSRQGLPIIKEFTDFMRESFRSKGVRLSYMLVVVPNEDATVWHIHMLLGDVPDGTFVPLHDVSVRSQMTEDARKKMEQGATVYGWPALGKRFAAKVFIQQIGDLDEYHNIIRQDGKAKYMENQVVNFRDCEDPRTLAEKLEAFRNSFPKGKRIFRHSLNLIKPEKVISKSVPADLLGECLSEIGLPMGPLGVAGKVDKAAAERLISKLGE